MNIDPLEGFTWIPSNYWGVIYAKDGMYWYYTTKDDGTFLLEGVSNLLIDSEHIIKQFEKIN